MQNLLLAPVSRSDIRAALANGAGRPLLPVFDSPRWEEGGAPGILGGRQAILEMAEAEAGEPLPALTDELYALFQETGERRAFEAVYFERRLRLGRAAMAAIFRRGAEPGVASLIRKMEETLDEYSWALPAHVGSPSGKNPSVIDLFAAETANVMAELLAVFGPLIPAEVARSLRERLRWQIFENYAQRHRDFAWSAAGMNWNAVCHQGVLGAALTIETDTELVARMLELARGCLPRFLDGFGADGSTSEGPGYWQYGFGRFAELNAQIEARTGGAFSLFEGDERIERIVRFAPACVLEGGHFVNFSDGPRTGHLDPALLFLLAERFPAVRAEAEAARRRLAGEGIDLRERRWEFFHLARVFLRFPSEAGTAPETREDVFFPDYGAVVARGGDESGNFWEFAAKAGNNYEHHNHNDCGSFLLNLNGAPAIVEIGAPEYVREYFGKNRYAFLAARTLGHSLPIVNGCEQSPGAEFAAEVLRCELTSGRVQFVVDLTRCYPAEAFCRRLIRSFDFDKRRGILSVADSYELAEGNSLETLVIVEAPIVFSPSVVELEAPGRRLRIVAHPDTLFTAAEEEKYRAHDGQPATIRRIRLGLEQPQSDGVAGYTVRLA